MRRTTYDVSFSTINHGVRRNRKRYVVGNMKRKRRPYVLVEISPGGGERRWDELPPELLRHIFRKVPFYILYVSTSCVCKLWRSSVLDVLFPIPGMLDLKKIDTMSRCFRNLYLIFFKILIDTHPKTQWKTLTTPSLIGLKGHAIHYIAERTPSLEYLHVNNAVQLGFYREALSYWKNLKGFTCDIRRLEISSLASELCRCCKNIRYLCIRGKLGAKEAIAIVNSLPELRRLSLERSSLTIGALLIFDGHKKLVTLDLQHSIFVGEKYLPSFCHRESDQVQLPLCQGIKAKKWNEDIREKVSGRKTYLRCEEKCRRQGLYPFQNTTPMVTCAIIMTEGDSAGPSRIVLVHSLGEIKKVWKTLPQPVRSFPWPEALVNFLELILGLSMLLPNTCLIVVTGIFKDATLELYPQLKEGEFPWHLVSVAFFFILVKLPVLVNTDNAVWEARESIALSQCVYSVLQQGVSFVRVVVYGELGLFSKGRKFIFVLNLSSIGKESSSLLLLDWVCSSAKVRRFKDVRLSPKFRVASIQSSSILQLSTECQLIAGGGGPLIPGLPDDVALDCLLRLPVESHPSCRVVCKRWHLLLGTKERFFSRRKELGYQDPWLFICTYQKCTSKIQWQVLDLTNLSWHTIPLMPCKERICPHGFRCISTPREGTIFVFCGMVSDLDTPLNLVLKYEIHKNCWSVMNKMTTASSFFACGIIDGMVYVAGAVHNGKLLVTEGWLWRFLFSPRGQVYDPRLNCWETMSANLREGWTGLSAVVDGHLFVVSEHERMKLKVYDVKTDSWEVVVGSPVPE
ncbi:hypothetical protein IFM89_037232 [Coptis chinensis]|uniref:F-box domain-containing protein n=1 Tax=Coptis chinensis TaxID=261450 RepID=A0A835LJU6_9MAGN|nr:hypothetical protein IFM89_037232 [Coptis chinensis]